MRKIKLEKSVKKIDREIEALKIAGKYLTNIEEINFIKDTLNQERQMLADELYLEDSKSYEEALEVIRELLNKELEKEEQMELLNNIKEIYGRTLPNVSKPSSGLNAWLKKIGVECQWIDNPEKNWATLVLTGFTVE